MVLILSLDAFDSSDPFNSLQVFLFLLQDLSLVLLLHGLVNLDVNLVSLSLDLLLPLHLVHLHFDLYVFAMLVSDFLLLFHFYLFLFFLNLELPKPLFSYRLLVQELLLLLLDLHLVLLLDVLNLLGFVFGLPPLLVSLVLPLPFELNPLLFGQSFLLLKSLSLP